MKFLLLTFFECYFFYCSFRLIEMQAFIEANERLNMHEIKEPKDQGRHDRSAHPSWPTPPSV